MGVVAHPQRLTALLARLFQRGQGHFMRRLGTRGSGSSDHGRSPAALFILLLAFLQATPAVKPSFPFREKNQRGKRNAATGVLARSAASSTRMAGALDHAQALLERLVVTAPTSSLATLAPLA